MLNLVFGPLGTAEHHAKVTRGLLGVSVVAAGAATFLSQQRYNGTAIAAATVALGCIADVVVWRLRSPRFPSRTMRTNVTKLGSAAKAIEPLVRWKYGRAVRKVLWDSKTRNAVAAALLAYGWLQCVVAATAPHVCSVATLPMFASRAQTTILGVWTIDKKNCASAASSVRFIAGYTLQVLGLCYAGVFPTISEFLDKRPSKRTAGIVALTGAVSWVVSVMLVSSSANFFHSVQTGDTSGEHMYRLISVGAVTLAYTAMLVARVFSCVDEEPSSGSEGRPHA